MRIHRPARASLVIMAACAAAQVAGQLTLPTLLGRTVDGIVGGTDSTRWLTLTGALVAALVLVALLDTYVGSRYLAARTATLRHLVVSHVLRLGPRGAAGFATGDLVSRVAAGAADAARAGPATVGVLVGVLPPLGSLGLLAWIDGWLAAAFLGGLLLAAGVLTAFTRRNATILTDYQRVQGGLAARLTEALGGVRTIAAAGTGDEEQRRVLALLPPLRGHGRLTWQVVARATAQAAIVGPVIEVVVLAAAGWALLDGRITPGELFAAHQYAVLGAGLGGVTAALNGLARAKSGTRRTREVLHAPALPYGTGVLPTAAGADPAAGAGRDAAAGAGGGAVEFRGVALHDGSRTLLHRFDLAVPAGSTLAVVGPSGAGKSLLAALAARLRDPDEGAVLLDGVPLPELSADALRAAVGGAFERPVLAGRTVGEAIGQGAGPAPVEAAARRASAHEVIMRLPHGYDTPLDDAPMSGGEAQRLGLARALVADRAAGRRLLVLDDATSSLDLLTELHVERALADGTTRLIVTHRAGIAARADRVVWLDAGHVRGIGPHRALWADPAYRAVFT
ncbi:ABC transporter ATP-binding protein [Pilimelia anulata]|uniref:ABC transporter ATP-binding protein n=1 Tax=Pilimelia anulata TaxID=53371 RepID=A0A8J3BD72_9ACTN|nr:ABC transporter ATP-binding protein [Pilimelia anulata]GGK06250.1 ABC transporter ATP-binding protein [Pilimelia anulata]